MYLFELYILVCTHFIAKKLWNMYICSELKGLIQFCHVYIIQFVLEKYQIRSVALLLFVNSRIFFFLSNIIETFPGGKSARNFTCVVAAL